MKIMESGTGASIQIPGAKWSSDNRSYQIGVRERSYVTSVQDIRDMDLIMVQDKGLRPDTEKLRKMDDNALISLFQGGNHDVFRILVERHQERIRNLLFSIFHSREFIDDIAQEVFIKAYQALPRFRFEASFYTWLYRIAVNKSRDELRKKKIHRFFSFQTLDEGIEHDLQNRMAVQPENRDVQELIGLGLRTLPDKFRIAVVLKDIDGLSYEEIAKVMHCELGTVKSRISRARTMLRKALKPLLEEVKA
jgi:RNA polymerase sigma-70 factor (ECF subfamily)